MIEKMLNSKAIMHRSLQANWARNQAIAENIANVDTPGYKRKVVSFEEELRHAMRSSDFQKSDSYKVPIKIITDQTSSSYRLDGNNVDIDTEMADLATNSLRYNAFINLSSYNNIKKVLE